MFVKDGRNTRKLKMVSNGSMTLSFFDFSTFFRASCLVMVRALWIAELNTVA